MKGAEAEAPSKVKTSTRATTPRNGAPGCGVIGTCDGVSAGAFNGVLIGVCDPYTGAAAFSATFLRFTGFCDVAGRLGLA